MQHERARVCNAYAADSLSPPLLPYSCSPPVPVRSYAPSTLVSDLATPRFLLYLYLFELVVVSPFLENYGYYSHYRHYAEYL